MAEIWKDIPIEGLEKYKVNSYSRIKSFSRYPKGKIIIPRVNQGYAVITLINTKNNRPKNQETYKFHRLIALTFVKNSDPDNKVEVNHDDGDRLNNLPYNLIWETPLGNTTHALETGLRKDKKGEDCKFSKITEGSVREIRELCNNGELTAVEIGKRFGITGSSVSKIQKRQTWKHVV